MVIPFIGREGLTWIPYRRRASQYAMSLPPRQISGLRAHVRARSYTKTGTAVHAMPVVLATS